MQRLNLHIPEELHKRFKVVCAQEGKEMSELVRAWIEKYVEQIEKKQKSK
jgi:metal-responsive CopG/Arc/MetJ family transcriptional regulator